MKIFHLFFYFSLIINLLNAKENNVYRVALSLLPDKINPFEETTTPAFFIIEQMYDRIFYKDLSGKIKSNFFSMDKTHAMNNTFTNYILCLQNDIKFSDGDLITNQDVIRSLELIHQQHETIFKQTKIITTNNCVIVKHNNPIIDYFDLLSARGTTILKINALTDKFPIGRGNYKISSHTKSKITLDSTNIYNNPDITKIEFYDARKITNTDQKLIDDWNYSAGINTPLIDNKEFNKISLSIPIVYALINRWKDSKEISLFSQCFWKIRDKFLKETDFIVDREPYDQILSPGYPGYRILFDENALVNDNINCFFTEHKHSVSYYLFFGNLEKTKRFFEKYFQYLPLKVIVIEKTPTEVVKKLLETQEYFITSIGFEPGGRIGSEGYDSYPFFDNFISGKNIIPVGLDNLKTHFQKNFNQNMTLKKQDEFYKTAQKILLSSGRFVPLARNKKSFYYRKNIKNIDFSNNFTGIPMVHKFKIKR